jgi:hypothetical protein
MVSAHQKAPRQIERDHIVATSLPSYLAVWHAWANKQTQGAIIIQQFDMIATQCATPRFACLHFLCSPAVNA